MRLIKWGHLVLCSWESIEMALKSEQLIVVYWRICIPFEVPGCLGQWSRFRTLLGRLCSFKNRWLEIKWTSHSITVKISVLWKFDHITIVGWLENVHWFQVVLGIARGLGLSCFKALQLQESLAGEHMDFSLDQFQCLLSFSWSSTIHACSVGANSVYTSLGHLLSLHPLQCWVWSSYLYDFA